MSYFEKADWYDSVEVYDAERTLEGYALVKRSHPSKALDDWEITEVYLGDRRILTPVRAVRSEAWADLGRL